MSTEYQLRFFNPQGAMVIPGISDFYALDLVRTANAPGAFTLSLPSDYFDIYRFTADWMVEVWRKPDAGALALDGETLWFTRKIRVERDRVLLSGHDTTGLLARRCVVWLPQDNAVSGTLTQGYKTAVPDYALAQLFNENFSTFTDNAYGQATLGVTGPAIPNPPGDFPGSIFGSVPSRSGVVGGLPFAPAAIDRAMPNDGSRMGVTLNVASTVTASEFDVAMQNVLTAMQEVAATAAAAGFPIYFDLVYTPDPTGGRIGSMNYRTWYHQRGTARNDLAIGPDYGNLENPVLELDFENEATWMHITGNQDALGSQVVAGVYNPLTFNRSLFYPIEAVADYGQDNTANQDGMISYGKAQLYEHRAVSRLTGDFIQTPNARFGVHYRYGDKLTARWNGVAGQALLNTYHITVEGDVETIALPITVDMEIP